MVRGEMKRGFLRRSESMVFRVLCVCFGRRNEGLVCVIGGSGNGKEGV